MDYDREARSPSMLVMGGGRGGSGFTASKRTRKTVEKSAAQRRLAQVIANNNQSFEDDGLIHDEDDTSWNASLHFGPSPAMVSISHVFQSFLLFLSFQVNNRSILCK